MKRRTVIVAVFAAVFVLGMGYSLWNYAANRDSFMISGVIEADDIHVGSRLGGRVLKVVAREGETVKAGEPMVLLEPDELNASLAEAEANLRQMDAKYALLNAGYRTEEIEQAEAAAKQAQAELNHLISAPRRQELDQAAADWAAAKISAENSDKTAELMKDLSKRHLIAKREAEDAAAKAEEAEQKVKTLRQRYDQLLAGTGPEEIARMKQRVTETGARLRQLRAGYRKEEIAQAKSALEAARAKVRLRRAELDETVIKAPADALVETLDLESGDLVAAGKPIATLLRAGSLWIRAYLPEARLRFVQAGDKVNIRVVSFPDRSFSGVVRRIQRQREVEPAKAQSPEERVAQVFPTEIVIDDPDHLLRPGMSADIAISKATVRGQAQVRQI
jgi:multidrug resistance efflux pump